MIIAVTSHTVLESRLCPPGALRPFFVALASGPIALASNVQALALRIKVLALALRFWL